MATYQVRTNANGQKILSDPLSGLSSTLATSELPGAVQPDGVTTKVDSAGIVSAIGGNLLTNDEIWITESGTFTAPVTGWYDLWMIGGGYGARYYPIMLYGGLSGAIIEDIIYLTAGQQVDVVVGAGGTAFAGDSYSAVEANRPVWSGGYSSFGTITTQASVKAFHASYGKDTRYNEGIQVWAVGGGFGGAWQDLPAFWYGGGGGGLKPASSSSPSALLDGYQGAIRLRFWNPAKAAGPVANEE